MVVAEKIAAGQRYRFNVDEYYRMADAGIFDEDSRVELIDGEVRQMVPIGGPHITLVNRLNVLLVRSISDRAMVSVQNPVRLSDETEPQPDFTLFKADEDFYGGQVPPVSNALIVIEVADSSLAYDRDKKMQLYASAGIPEAWLVDVAGEVVTLFTGPGESGYAQQRTLKRGDEIVSTTIDDLHLPVDEVFGGSKGGS
jgi:Uma2 family endonuclease